MGANFVSMIVFNQKDEVLLVQAQGDNDVRAYWTLPGGRVEIEETAPQAAIREVLEETGITVLSAETIAYQTEITFNDRRTQAIVYSSDQWHGEINPQDDEGEILNVGWFTRAQAIAHLKDLDYPPMSEPPIAFISKQKEAGTRWRYRVNQDGAHWVNND